MTGGIFDTVAEKYGKPERYIKADEAVKPLKEIVAAYANGDEGVWRSAFEMYLDTFLPGDLIPEGREVAEVKIKVDGIDGLTLYHEADDATICASICPAAEEGDAEADITLQGNTNFWNIVDMCSVSIPKGPDAEAAGLSHDNRDALIKVFREPAEEDPTEEHIVKMDDLLDILNEE